MELIKRLSHRRSANAGRFISSVVRPANYTEMDEWLNNFSAQEWTAILGAYAAGGFANVVSHMRTVYSDNVAAWRDKDLRHYWNSRTWSDFKSKAERSIT